MDKKGHKATLLSRCDGRYMRGSDPAACCQNADFVPCPGEFCRENTAASGDSVQEKNRKGVLRMLILAACTDSRAFMKYVALQVRSVSITTTMTRTGRAPPAT